MSTASSIATLLTPASRLYTAASLNLSSPATLHAPASNSSELRTTTSPRTPSAILSRVELDAAPSAPTLHVLDSLASDASASTEDPFHPSYIQVSILLCHRSL